MFLSQYLIFSDAFELVDPFKLKLEEYLEK